MCGSWGAPEVPEKPSSEDPTASNSIAPGPRHVVADKGSQVTNRDLSTEPLKSDPGVGRADADEPGSHAPRRPRGCFGAGRATRPHRSECAPCERRCAKCCHPPAHPMPDTARGAATDGQTAQSRAGCDSATPQLVLYCKATLATCGWVRGDGGATRGRRGTLSCPRPASHTAESCRWGQSLACVDGEDSTFVVVSRTFY